MNYGDYDVCSQSCAVAICLPRILLDGLDVLDS